MDCRNLFACSRCVREGCWWLVFEDYHEECSPVLAGVPGVHEWFYGPGDCREFHCNQSAWDWEGKLIFFTKVKEESDRLLLQ